jgi:hypothetical protein
MTNRLQSAAGVLALAMLPAAATRATPAPVPIVAKEVLPRERARDLYSMRARRMMANYLRLRLLELREAELDRVRAVIEGKLGVDALFSPSPNQAGARGTDR